MKINKRKYKKRDFRPLNLLSDAVCRFVCEETPCKLSREQSVNYRRAIEMIYALHIFTRFPVLDNRIFISRICIEAGIAVTIIWRQTLRVVYHVLCSSVMRQSCKIKMGIAAGTRYTLENPNGVATQEAAFRLVWSNRVDRNLISDRLLVSYLFDLSSTYLVRTLIPTLPIRCTRSSETNIIYYRLYCLW